MLSILLGVLGTFKIVPSWASHLLRLALIARMPPHSKHVGICNLYWKIQVGFNLTYEISTWVSEPYTGERRGRVIPQHTPSTRLRSRSLPRQGNDLFQGKQLLHCKQWVPRGGGDWRVRYVTAIKKIIQFKELQIALPSPQCHPPESLNRTATLPDSLQQDKNKKCHPLGRCSPHLSGAENHFFLRVGNTPVPLPLPFHFLVILLFPFRERSSESYHHSITHFIRIVT